MNALPIVLVRIGVIVVALMLWYWTQRLISRKATHERHPG